MHHSMRIPRLPTSFYRRNGGYKGEGLYRGLGPRVLTVIKLVMNIKIIGERKIVFSAYTEYPFFQNVFGRAPSIRASTRSQEKGREDRKAANDIIILSRSFLF